MMTGTTTNYAMAQRYVLMVLSHRIEKLRRGPKERYPLSKACQDYTELDKAFATVDLARQGDACLRAAARLIHLATLVRLKEREEDSSND